MRDVKSMKQNNLKLINIISKNLYKESIQRHNNMKNKIDKTKIDNKLNKKIIWMFNRGLNLIKNIWNR